MTSHVTLRQELNKQKQWIVLGEKKNVIKTIGNAFFFIFRGEFAKNELCLLIALFICTVCIVLVSDSVKGLCKLGNCTKRTHKIFT